MDEMADIMARIRAADELIERLRNALLAIAPLAEVPGTPPVVREKLLGNIRKALRP